jgi:hypothetical protein
LTIPNRRYSSDLDRSTHVSSRFDPVWFLAVNASVAFGVALLTPFLTAVVIGRTMTCFSLRFLPRWHASCIIVLGIGGTK